MSGFGVRLMRLTLLFVALVLATSALTAAQAFAGQPLSDVDEAEWRVEQPLPPSPPPGFEGPSITTPVGLGHVGDIEFWAPNRGALITAGNGSTIPPGVWFYNGQGWRELSKVCGATDGRIAWAGENEFWTISDGRPGQAAEALGKLPPLEDDTLCHFAPPPGEPQGPLEVVTSYATPAFQSNSYEAMDAAACLNAEDCWFGGEPLPAPQVGAFELHWNGHTLTAEPYLPEGHAVRDMRAFEGRLYESLLLSTSDRVIRHSLELPALLRTGEEAASEFEPLPAPQPPLYGPGEFPYALNYLHLSSDENALWGAAGPAPQPPEKSKPAGLTVIRYSRIQYVAGVGYIEEGSPKWSQVLGPQTEPSGLSLFPEDEVTSIAAEPGTNSAWIGLDPESDSDHSPTEPARLLRISAGGAISDELELPTSEEVYGPKGAVEKIVCPAAHDCWMVTDQGWLLHLSTPTERQLAPETDPVFSVEPITYRPPDESLPQQQSVALPVNDSGEEATGPSSEALKSPLEVGNTFAEVTVPLVSALHTKLHKGEELELSFSLAVRARVRLLAERHKRVVAKTAQQTLPAGKHQLMLHLSRRQWPTKLNLQAHALAPLPKTTVKEAVGVPEIGSNGRVTTSASLTVLPQVPSFAQPGFRP
jgi:hypothetical protein